MRLPLFVKIFFIQMLLLVFVAGLITLAACFSLEQMQQEAASDNLRLVSAVVAKEAAERAGLYRDTLEKLGGKLAEIPDTQKIPGVLSKEIQPEPDFWRFFTSLDIADQEGNPLLRLPMVEAANGHGPEESLPADPGDRPLLDAALAGEQAIISDAPAPAPGGEGYSLSLAFAAKNNGQTRSLLLARAPLADFFPATPNGLLHKRGQTMLVNRHGLVLAASRPELVMQTLDGYALNHVTSGTGDEPVRRIMINGMVSLMAARQVPGAPWQSLAVMPLAQPWESSIAFREFISLFSPGILLLAGLLSFLSAWLLGRPFRRLARACAVPEKIADLDSGDKIFHHRGEAGEIAQAMLALAIRLDDTQNKTDDLVAWRTASQEKNAAAEKGRQEFIARLRAELGFQAAALERLSDELRTPGISMAGNNLRKLSENLFDLYSVEGGGIDLSPAPFSLHDFAEKIARKNQNAALGKGIDLVYEKDGAVPTTIYGDEARIGHALESVLAVVIALARQGTVGLRVRPLALKGANGSAAIRFQFEISCAPEALAGAEEKALLAALTGDEQLRPEDFYGLWLDLAPVRHLLRLLNATAGARQSADGEPVFYLEFNLPIVTGDGEQAQTASGAGG